MKRLAIMGGAFALAGAAHAGLIDPALQDVLDRAGPDETVSALVYLVDQVDTAALTDLLDAERPTLAERHETVVRALQDTAAHTQADLVARLGALVPTGRVSRFEAFWLANVVRVDAVPEELRAIADRPDVDWVYLNYEIELIEPPPPPAAAGGGGAILGGVEPGVEAVRAPEVWAMGITGEGVLVATLDTGVDGNHPALASRWRGVADGRYSGHPEWAWFDPVTHTNFPTAFTGHGTHTMGSVCGGAPGDQIGVAPGAQWIHAATIDRVSLPRTVSDSILAFQWLVDPDGDPSTNWDVPASCSNSWGLTTSSGYPPCHRVFWSYLDACEAAGIVIIFSAGNEGYSGLRRPADRATDDYRTHAVAAVDANIQSWPIASFSSRGPTFCTPNGTQAIKPDISAPGVNVRSSIPGGGYGDGTGTSMASPHVNGVVALMRQANPDLTVEEVKQIIYDTAFDLGSEGEDNSYGWGMIDAFEAVNLSLSLAGLQFSFPDGLPEFVDPHGGTSVRVVVTGTLHLPQSGTGVLHYSTGGDFTAIPMDEVEENVYDAVFPTFVCGDRVSYYFSAEDTDGDVNTNPRNAPDETYTADAYVGLDVIFHDDFEQDRDWTVTNSDGLSSGRWERGVPDGLASNGATEEDADGSGQCFVTGLFRDDDIDGGSTTLTSWILDASDPNAAVSYWRWYSNTRGGDPENDVFVIEVSDDVGLTWHGLEIVGPGGPEVDGGWFFKSFRVADVPGIENTDRFRIRFTVSDLNAPSIVEAGVDGVTLDAFQCGDLVGDANGDGVVNFEDLLRILGAWGPCEGCPEDVNGDGFVGFADILLVLSNWS